MEDLEFPQLDKLVEWFLMMKLRAELGQEYGELDARMFIDMHEPLISLINDILIDYKKYNINK